MLLSATADVAGRCRPRVGIDAHGGAAVGAAYVRRWIAFKLHRLLVECRYDGPWGARTEAAFESATTRGCAPSPLEGAVADIVTTEPLEQRADESIAQSVDTPETAYRAEPEIVQQGWPDPVGAGDVVVVSTSPLSNAGNVALNPDAENDPSWPTVSATFDTAVTSPLAWKSFYAYSAYRGVMWPTPALDPTATTATIDLGQWHATEDERLFAGETIRAVVRDTVTEAAGGMPADPAQWTFTMGASATSPGEFPQAVPVDDGDSLASQEASLADLDADGDLDLVVATSNESVRLYENDGAGSFSSWMTVGSPSTTGPTVAVGDVNLDGWVDLVVGVTSDRNFLFLHTGAAETPYATATAIGAAGTSNYDTKALDLADMDNDGDLDLVEATAAGEPSNIYFFDSGAFQNAVALSSDTDTSYDLAIGDVDNDGWLDVALANYSLTQTNKLYRNDPTLSPAFWGGTPITSDAQYSRTIELVDLNSDRFLDIVVGNDGAAGGMNRVYASDGAGMFPAGQDLGAAADATHAVRAADVDGDGDQDLIVGNFEAPNLLYINQGGSAIAFDAAAQVTSDAYRTRDVLTGDLDGDNDLDLIAIDQNAADHTYLNTHRPQISDMSLSPSILVDATEGYNRLAVTLVFDQAMDTAPVPTITFSDDIYGEGRTLTDMATSWQDAHTLLVRYTVVDVGRNLEDVGFTVAGAVNTQQIETLPREFAGAFDIHMQNPTVTSIAPTTDVSGGSAVTTINLETLAAAAEFRLAITFNEPMNTARAPSVVLDTAGDPTETLGAPTGQWADDTHYVLTYPLNAASHQRLTHIGVSVSGGENADGNDQIDSTTAAVFTIDTVRPVIDAITVDPNTLSQSDVGDDRFAVTVAYSKPMDTDPNHAPAVAFDAGETDLSGTLAFSHGVWSPDALEYTAWYDVSNDFVEANDVSPQASGGLDSGGNAPDTQPPGSVETFDIDMGAPRVLGVAPASPWLGTTTTSFYVDIRFDKRMNEKPTIVDLSPNVAGFLTYDPVASAWTDATKEIFRAVLTLGTVPADTLIDPSAVSLTVSGGRDALGNLQDAFSGAAGFGVDTVRPRVSDLTAVPATITTEEQGGQLVVTLTYDDTMNPASRPTLAFDRLEVLEVLEVDSEGWDDPLAPSVYTVAYNVTTVEHDLGDVGVTVTAAEDKALNPQETLVAADLLDINTVGPQVESIVPSTSLIENDDIGPGAFSIAVNYNKAMDTFAAPTIAFDPDASSTLALSGGAWTPDGRTYTASYDVIDADRYIRDIDITIAGATDPFGNVQTEFTSADAFTIEMRGAIVTAIEPATALGPYNPWVNRSRIGLWYPVAVTFDKTMDTSVTPTVTLSSNVASYLTFDPPTSSWSADGRTFYGMFDVGEGQVEIEPEDIAVQVEGGLDLGANVQVPFAASGIFGFDMIAPHVDGDITADPVLVTSADTGSYFELAIDYSETMAAGATPVLGLAGSPDPTGVLAPDAGAGVWQASGARWLARYVVADVEQTGGPYEVSVSGAEDRAGNPQTPASEQAVFSIDTVRPTVNGVDATPLVLTEDTTGQEAMRIRIDFSKAMDAAVAPAIDFGAFTSQVAEVLSLDTAASRWIDADTFEAVYDVVDRNADIAAVPITVSAARDASGNVMTPHIEHDVFRLDIESLYVTTVDFSDTLLSQSDFGATWTVGVSYTKRMDTSLHPTIGFSPDVSDLLAPAVTPGVWLDDYTYEARYDVDPIGERLAVVTVEVSGGADLRGDAPPPFTAVDAFDVDTVSPVPLNVDAEPPAVNLDDIGDQLVLTIRFGEDMETTAPPPTIAFPVEDPSNVLQFDRGEWDDPRTYAAYYDVLTGGSVVEDVDVTVAGSRDLLGNVQQTPALYGDLFAIDMVRPTVDSFVLSRTNVTEDHVGQLVTATIVFDEPMDTAVAPVVSFSDPAVLDALRLETAAWQADRQTFVAAYRVTRAACDVDRATITVTAARDAAGNRLSPEPYVAPAELTVTMTPLEVEHVTASAECVTRDMLGQSLEITVGFNKGVDTSVLPDLAFTDPQIDTVLALQSRSWTDSRTLTATYTVRTDAAAVDVSAGLTIDGAVTPTGHGQLSAEFSGVFTVDLEAPRVLNIVASPAIVNTTHIGAATFAIRVAFDEDMDSAVAPTVSFPSEDPGLILRPGESAWVDERTFQAVYSVRDVRLIRSDIDVCVEGGRDVGGNTLDAPVTQADLFDIDLVRPRVVDFAMSDTAVTSEMVGGDALWFRVTFDKTMATGTRPAFSFSEADASDVLQLNSAQSRWLDATTYEAHFDVLDIPTRLRDIRVTVGEARDASGNTQTPSEAAETLAIQIAERPVVARTSPLFAHLAVGDSGPLALSVDFSHAMDTSVSPSIEIEADGPLGLVPGAGAWQVGDPTRFEQGYTVTAPPAPAVVDVEFSVRDAMAEGSVAMTPYDAGLLRVLVTADLGTVDFLRMEDVENAGSGLAYELTAAHDARLTVESGATVVLLDAALREVARGTSGRVDHTASAGEAYYFYVETDAPRVDLTIANLVDDRSADVYVHDTAGDDALVFSAGASDYALEINGVRYTYDESDLGSLLFEGTPGGSDSADLHGAPAAETAVFRPLELNVDRDGVYTVRISDTPQIAWDGGGGDDRAVFYDSGLADDEDQFFASPSEAFFRGTGYHNEAINVPDVEGYATSSSVDRAKLVDSSGADTVAATPDRVDLGGDGFSLSADGFQYVAVYGTAGGSDTATIADTPGDDSITATPQEVILAGVGQRFRGFEQVTIHASGGSDSAVLYDSMGDDTLEIGPLQTRLYADSYEILLNAFSDVEARAGGGHDTAVFSDRNGQGDLFSWSPDAATLEDAAGTTYLLSARYFDTVLATASGDAGDQAALATGLGVNRLAAQGGGLSLVSTVWETVTTPLELDAFSEVTADGDARATNTREVGAIDFALTFAGVWDA